MKSMLKILFVITAASLCAPVLAEPSKNLNNGQGLAIGQSQTLLQMTRIANAGVGNGGEFIRLQGSFSVIGCSSHNLSDCFSPKYVEIDPGNSGTHNQSLECDFIGCVFDPYKWHHISHSHHNKLGPGCQEIIRKFSPSGTSVLNDAAVWAWAICEEGLTVTKWPHAGIMLWNV